MKDVRAEAAKTIAQVLNAETAFSDDSDAIQNLLGEQHVKDKAFYRELCYGTLRHYFRLNGEIAPLLRKPLAKKDSDVYALILSGAYQISQLRTPDHAALNASVEATKALKKTWAKGLVNAILRNYLRQQNNDPAKRVSLSEAEAHSHPQWLFQRIKEDWPEAWQQIIAANTHYPPMSLRINLAHCQRDEYAQRLKQHEVSCSLSDTSPSAITLDKASEVSSLPHFADGWVSVQDVGAQLAADLLQLNTGTRLLDACAAPGGKTLHALDIAPNYNVTAIDSSSERLLKVKENLTRSNHKATLIHADANATEDWWDGKPFDRILLDAPCSATGVIGRHPDIKLLRRREDIDSFVAQQQQLIQNLWPLLDVGGLMVYATCSIMKEENQELVEQFLATTNDARIETITADWGVVRGPGRQLLPNPGKNDGFYYAVLSKNVRV